MIDPQLLGRIDRRRFVYRTIPARPGRMLGVGSYPKGESSGRKHAAYYLSYCKQEEYSGVYLIRGAGVYRDSDGNEYPLRAGDFFHRLPGLRHWAIPERGSGWLELFLCMPMEVWLGWQLCLAHTPQLLGKWHIGVRVGLIREFIALQDGLEQCPEDRLGEFALQMQHLMYELYRLSRLSGEDGEMQNPIRRACMRLRDDLGRKLDLEALAAELGMNYETFRRRFMREMGITPGAFRNRQRIEKACQLLRENEMTNSEIAFHLGYSNGFVFSRQFKKSTGRSPSAFAGEAE